MSLQEALKSATVFPRLRFLYHGDELSARVKAVGAIAHEYETLLVGGCTVDLVCDAALRRAFLASAGDDESATALNKEGRIELELCDSSGAGLKDAADAPLVVPVFKGRAGEPKISGLVLQLPLLDRFDALDDIKPAATSDLPDNPAELVWQLLTKFASYDCAMSASNVDIDYASWSHWRTVCSEAQLALGLKLDGSQSLKDLLGKIAEYTLSAIFAGRDGKLHFSKLRPSEVPASVATFDADKLLSLSLERITNKIINQVTVASGLKTVDESSQWGEEVQLVRPSSQASYETKQKRYKSDDVWHKTTVSANHMAKGLLDMYEDPFSQISFDIPLEGLLLNPGDVVGIEHELYGLNEQFRIIRIQENLSSGKVTIKAREVAMESEWCWDHVYSANRPPQEDLVGGQAWQRLNQAASLDRYEETAERIASAAAHVWTSPALACQGKTTLNWSLPSAAGGLGTAQISAVLEEYGDAACSIALGPATLLASHALTNQSLQYFNDQGQLTLKEATRGVRLRRELSLSSYDDPNKLKGSFLGCRLAFEPLSLDGRTVRLASPTVFQRQGYLSAASVGNTVELCVNVLAADAANPFVLSLADGSREIKLCLTAPTNGNQTFRLALKDGLAPALWINAERKLAFDWSRLPGVTVTSEASSANCLLWGFSEGEGRALAVVDYLKICRSGYYESDLHACYPALLGPSDKPPVVENLRLVKLSRLLADGRYQAQIKVSFDKPEKWFFDLSYLVYCRYQNESASTTYVLMAETSETEIVIPATPGLNYVKVVSKRAGGAASDMETSPEATLVEAGRPYIAKVAEFKAAATNEGDFKLAWLPVTATDADILDYEVRLDEKFGSADEKLIARVKGLECLYKAPKSGQHCLYIRAHDIWGYYAGESAVASLAVVVPAKVAELKREVIDNNVLLRWSGVPTTFPIKEYVIRRAVVAGCQAGAWEQASEIARIKGNFFYTYENTPGSFAYFIRAVDMADNLGEAETVMVSVTEPPDLVHIGAFKVHEAFAGTKNNVIVTQGRLIIPAKSGESWAQREATYASPKAQFDAGFACYAQPVPTSGLYVTQPLDLGRRVPVGHIKLEPVFKEVCPGLVLKYIVEVSADASLWKSCTESLRALGNDFRYIRVTIEACGDGKAFAAFEQLNVYCDVRNKADAGNGTSSTNSGGVFVPFNKTFDMVTSLTVTPKLELTAGQLGEKLVAIYDFDFLPGEAGFYVHIFNQSTGERRAAAFTWVAEGY